MAERVGLLKTIPGFHPAGALHATKFVPDKFVKPTVTMRQCLRSPLLRQIKTPLKRGLLFGGEGGIRTHGPLARSTVFETAPFDHSGTSPF